MLYLIVITFKKIDPTKSQGANRKRKKPGAGKSGFILKTYSGNMSYDCESSIGY